MNMQAMSVETVRRDINFLTFVKKNENVGNSCENDSYFFLMTRNDNTSNDERVLELYLSDA